MLATPMVREKPGFAMDNTLMLLLFFFSLQVTSSALPASTCPGATAIHASQGEQNEERKIFRTS
jgi:hypothetical protein